MREEASGDRDCGGRSCRGQVWGRGCRKQAEVKATGRGRLQRLLGKLEGVQAMDAGSVRWRERKQVEQVV